MWFFNSFYRSLFDIAWLREQRGRLGRAFGYAFIFLILIYGLRASQLAFFVVPKVLETAETEFIQNAPDFVATWKNEHLSVTGLPQPYIIEKTIDGDTLRLVIDTVSTSTSSIESFIKDREHDAVILATRDNASFYDPDTKGIDTQSFAGMEDETVTKADVAGIISKIRSYGHWIGGAILVVGIVLAIIGKLIGLLILSLLIYIFVWIKKYQWTYREIYTVGLYAMTLPTLIFTTSAWLKMPLGPLGTIAFYFIMYLVVSGYDSQEKKA